MSQLRLAYVNCKIVSRNSNAWSQRSKTSSLDSSVSPHPLMNKIDRLNAMRPAAVGVIEKLVDDLLREAEGRKL